jgi:dolichyl-phosphate-mannose-protein mannosyltransferase
MRSTTFAKRALLFLWVAFVIRGLWYSAMMPVWEGYDESYHFAYLQYVAAGKTLFSGTAGVSLEVQHSLHLLPLAWELSLQGLPQPLITDDSFWQLSAKDRDILTSGVRNIPPEEWSQPATEAIPNYEFQQAPLYYWLFSVPMCLMARATLLSRVMVLRMLSVMLASIVVPLAYRIAREIFGDDRKALGVTALLVLLPELMVNVARVGNESPALVLMTIALIYALRAVEKPESWSAWIALGLTLGLGLLAKAYFLVTLPAFLLIGVYLIWASRATPESKRRTIAITFRWCAACGIILAVAGRWYWRVHATTGSWSGIIALPGLRNISLAEKLAAIPHVNWRSGAISVLLSHIWFGGWSFLRLPVGWYILAAVPITIAVVGVIVRLVRAAKGSAWDTHDSQIAVLAAFYGCFVAGLAYHVLVTFLSLGISASTGWYLYCAVVSEIVLLVWGLETFFRAKLVVLLVCAGAAVLDLYGMHALMLPYYVGLSVHAGQHVPPAMAATMSHLPTVFERLAVNKPGWLGVPVVIALWFLYLGPTLGTLLVCAKALATPSPRSPPSLGAN